MSNCPLCRAPIKSTSESGRYNTCYGGHETNVKSVLPGVLPTMPGWIGWQTGSNSGISEMRYRFWGAENTAYYKQRPEREREIGQDLIDQYEDWMNHASHGPRIEWELDCAVPEACIAKQLREQKEAVAAAQSNVDTMQSMLDEHYPKLLGKE